MDEFEADLFPADSHHGVTCDGCSTANFSGIRHKCFVCFDYDLCNECVISGATSKQHLTTHPMQSIMPSSTVDYDMYLGDDYELDREGERGEAGGGTTGIARGGGAVGLRGAVSRLAEGNSQTLLYPPSDFLDDGAATSSVLYKCPYCDIDGYSEQQLITHVNDAHGSDPKLVVCPICASAPGGDPNYVSRNFHGHLELRHFRDRPKRTRKPTFSSFANSSTAGSASRLADPIVDLFSEIYKKKIPKDIANSGHTSVKTKSSAGAKHTTKSFPLLSSLQKETLTEQQRTESNNKKILKSVFLQELLLSTLVQESGGGGGGGKEEEEEQWGRGGGGK